MPIIGNYAKIKLNDWSECVMKFDKTNIKIILFVFTSILIPALVQLISENLLNFTFLEDQPILSFLIYCAFFIVATVLILLVG